MQHIRISPIILVLVLFPQPVVGQQRSVDLRGQWGHTYLLEDTPPHAWIGGGSVTAAVGPRLRLGLEVLQANMFGRYSNFKERATLVNPVVEIAFSPGQRFNPYLVIGGGYTQYRLLPWLSYSRESTCRSVGHAGTSGWFTLAPCCHRAMTGVSQRVRGS